MREKKILLQVLEHLKGNGPIRPNCGICENAELLCLSDRHAVVVLSPADYPVVYKIMKDTFDKWPEFSGDRLFPISTNSRKKVVDQYYKAMDSKSMWSTKKPYGRARWRLLDWMISKLHSDLSDDDIEVQDGD